MFVAQVDIILLIEPKSFIIEMSSSVLVVNEGKEVTEVCERLSEKYHVHIEQVKVWEAGDPSNRRRCFVCGFHVDDVGEAGQHFEFPKAKFKAETGRFPVALDIAVPDWEVEEECIIRDQPPLLPWTEPKPGRDGGR